jgi:hypothetical protein
MLAMSVFPSPLESFARVYVRESPDATSEECRDQAFETLRALIHGEITADSAAATLRATLGYDQPVQRILQILSVGPDPLPYSAAAGEARPGSQRMPVRPWTECEDHRLIAALHRHGLENWQAVADFVGNGRTRSQCAQRWNRGLNPDIFKGPWSPADEAKLADLVARLGEKAWKKISSHFSNRSDVQCRYHYQLLQRRSPRQARARTVPRPDAGAHLVFEELARPRDDDPFVPSLWMAMGDADQF